MPELMASRFEANMGPFRRNGPKVAPSLVDRSGASVDAYQ